MVVFSGGKHPMFIERGYGSHSSDGSFLQREVTSSHFLGLNSNVNMVMGR